MAPACSRVAVPWRTPTRRTHPPEPPHSRRALRHHRAPRTRWTRAHRGHRCRLAQPRQQTGVPRTTGCIARRSRLCCAGPKGQAVRPPRPAAQLLWHPALLSRAQQNQPCWSCAAAIPVRRRVNFVKHQETHPRRSGSSHHRRDVSCPDSAPGHRFWYLSSSTSRCRRRRRPRLSSGSSSSTQSSSRRLAPPIALSSSLWAGRQPLRQAAAPAAHLASAREAPPGGAAMPLRLPRLSGRPLVSARTRRLSEQNQPRCRR